MPASKPPNYAGWAAILSAIATLAMLITAILSSRLNLGNTFRMFVLTLMALIILMALALHTRLRSVAPRLSLAAAAMAILGASLTAVAHVLQMASALPEAEFNTVGEGIGPSGIGLWLLLTNYMALQGRALPRLLASLGFVAGLGYLASGVGALIRGPESDNGSQNLLSSIGPLGIFFVYPAWAVWLGIWMIRQAKQVTAQPAVVKPGP